MSTQRTDILSIVVGCHAYPWHEACEEPNSGPDYDIRFAETYGVMVRFLSDDWCWTYEAKGPYDNLLRFLTEEYAGGEQQAREMLDYALEHPDEIAEG